MSYKLESTQISGGKHVFYRVDETAIGGFGLDIANLVAGVLVPAGTIMGFDEDTRTATPLKTAKMQASATDAATTYKVEKGHLFEVGDNIGKTIGGKAYTISEIDTSNADYDVLTVGTTLGVTLVAGDVLIQSGVSGASACAYAVEPKGLLHNDVKAEESVDVGVVLRGTVFERRIAPITDGIKAKMPLILFTKSY